MPGLRDQQAIVELHTGSVSYRVNGDFTHAGKQAAAPLVQVSLPRPLAIMKHQVSSSDYQRCVDDGACRALDRGVVVAGRPAGRADQLARCQRLCRLAVAQDRRNLAPADRRRMGFRRRQQVQGRRRRHRRQRPSKRWIARYEREADRAPSDAGHAQCSAAFGSNENGLQDIGGNVWEWTASCFVRRVLDDAGKVVSENPNCGVRVVEGQHRAYVTDFIRDAKAGGCAVGVPPDNLGFRLVVERDKWPGVQRLVTRLKAFL